MELVSQHALAIRFSQASGRGTAGPRTKNLAYGFRYAFSVSLTGYLGEVDLDVVRSVRSNDTIGSDLCLVRHF